MIVVLLNIEEFERNISIAKLCDLKWTKVWNDSADYQTTLVETIKYMSKIRY